MHRLAISGLQAEGRVIGLEDGLPADDSGQHPDIGDLFGLCIQRAAIQDHEVGELSRLQ
jgi:hypothetical protein